MCIFGHFVIFIGIRFKNNVDTEYPLAGPNKSLQTRFQRQRSTFQVQRSKGPNDPTVHKYHVMLIYPANMKQLAFIVSRQWPKQHFQSNGHNVKVVGQNNPIAHRSHGKFICPDNINLFFLSNSPDNIFKVMVLMSRSTVKRSMVIYLDFQPHGGIELMILEPTA